MKQRHPHNKHGKVEEPSEVHELTSLTGLTVTAASGNWNFLLCLHPAFTDMNKLELTGGGLIFKVLFDGRSAYFSFKRYLAAKICFLKYPKIHNYISSCCIDPATVHAPSSTTKSCNSGRSFSSEDKAWRCSDTKHHLGQTSIRNSRELRQFALPLLSLDATCFQMCPHGEMQKWKSRYRCVLGAPLRSLSVTIITVMSIIYEHNIFHN